MATRTVVLVDEFDKRLGAIQVADVVHVIRHKGGLYVRTAKGVRLSGGGIGVVFEPTEVYVRDQLNHV